jgi:hypothetical protein
LRVEGLIICLIAGVIAALIANAKGRSPIAWFLLGFFFPIIAIIIVSVLEGPKAALEHRRRDIERAHRVREQIRQHEVKNEAFQRHAGARLDAHDRALGINTRDAAPLEAGEAAASLAPGAPPPIPVAWHYAAGDQQHGPVDESTLRELLLSGNLSPATLVWTEGMPEWRPARDFPELHA